MTQATIAWSVLLNRLAKAGMTITMQLPDLATPASGWYVRLLDDSLDWDGPYPDPLAALDQSVQIQLSAYADTLRDAGDALYWETPSLRIGVHVTVDGVKGSWTVTLLLDDGYVRVGERLRGTMIDVDAIRCITSEDDPPRASTA
jgi:hypothetical protein